MVQKVTLNDIAREAKVSASTVSRVLTGSQAVSPAVRQAVLEAARLTGYLTNEQQSIAIIIPPFGQMDGYLMLLISALSSELYRRRFRPVILAVNDVSFLDDYSFQGIISICFTDGLEKGWNSRHRLPLVAINTIPALHQNVYSVCSNDTQGVELALDHLVGQGHRSIGLLTFNRDSRENMNFRHRVTAFEQYFANRKNPVPALTGYRYNITESLEVPRAVREFADLNVTAILVTGENHGAIVLRVLRDLRIKVPEEMSLIAYENPTLNHLLDPPLTTIEQNLANISAEAANLLSRQINGKKVQNVTVDYHLIERQSVAKR